MTWTLEGYEIDGEDLIREAPMRELIETFLRKEFNLADDSPTYGAIPISDGLIDRFTQFVKDYLDEMPAQYFIEEYATP